MTKRSFFILMIGVMVIVSSCQFKANPVVWSVTEVDGTQIEYITYAEAEPISWKPFANLIQKKALPDTFTEIEFAKHSTLVVGLVFEQRNPMYSQGMPAFFDTKTNTLKSCQDAPLFWDFSIHSTSDSSVLVIGDTFDSLILFDIKSCQTVKVIKEMEQLRPLSGISWNKEKELLAYSKPNNDGVYEIFLTYLDGTQREAIGEGNYPRWSPDGEQIALASDEKTIIVKRIENSETVTYKLPERLILRSEKFSWSSDGSRIAFSAEKTESDGSTSFQIFILNLMTSQVEELGIEGRSPVWVYD